MSFDLYALLGVYADTVLGALVFVLIMTVALAKFYYKSAHALALAGNVATEEMEEKRLTPAQLGRKLCLLDKLAQIGISQNNISSNHLSDELAKLEFTGEIPEELVCDVSYDIMPAPFILPESKKPIDFRLVYLDMKKHKFPEIYRCPFTRLEIKVGQLISTPFDTEKLAAVNAFMQSVREEAKKRNAEARLLNDVSQRVVAHIESLSNTCLPQSILMSLEECAKPDSALSRHVMMQTQEDQLHPDAVPSKLGFFYYRMQRGTLELLKTINAHSRVTSSTDSSLPPVSASKGLGNK